MTEWRRSIAGAERNVAIGLARPGLKVGYLSRVGQDSFGRSVLAALAREGVSGALVVQFPGDSDGLPTRTELGT